MNVNHLNTHPLMLAAEIIRKQNYELCDRVGQRIHNFGPNTLMFNEFGILKNKNWLGNLKFENQKLTFRYFGQNNSLECQNICQKIASELNVDIDFVLGSLDPQKEREIDIL